MPRRYRRVDAQPGELKVAFGSAGTGEPADVVYAWGDGVPKGDSWLLYIMLSCERAKPDLSAMDGYTVEPSLIEQLKARGYDISTLKFSIRKKTDGSSASQG
jgi:hypothetical protein